MTDDLALIIEATPIGPEPGMWTPMFHVFSRQTCDFCWTPIERTRGSVELKPGDQPSVFFNAELNAYECPGCRAEAERVAPARAAACQEWAARAAIGVPVAGPSEAAHKDPGDPGAAACATSESALTNRSEPRADRIQSGSNADLP